jgi:hypothetical protein
MSIQLTTSRPQPERRVIISGTVLGLGGIRTHLTLLCRLLLSHGVEVVVFATGVNWNRQELAESSTADSTPAIPQGSGTVLAANVAKADADRGEFGLLHWSRTIPFPDPQAKAIRHREH